MSNYGGTASRRSFKRQDSEARRLTSTKTPYHYSIQHIRDLRAVIRLRGMSTPKGFDRVNCRRLQKVYNGIGPEAWSSKFRAAITWALSVLESPALIHDYEYSLRDKSYWRFTKANLRLMWNAWKDGRFRAGIVAAALCQLFGYKGYKSGGKVR